MSLQSAGRAQLAKMRRLGTPGTKLVTFRLIDTAAYDPVSGENVQTVTEVQIKVFATKGTAQESKSGSIITTEYDLVFEMGLLPRVPLTQDEVIMDGILYKVTDSGGDPMGVQLKVGVSMA